MGTELGSKPSTPTFHSALASSTKRTSSPVFPATTPSAASPRVWGTSSRRARWRIPSRRTSPTSFSGLETTGEAHAGLHVHGRGASKTTTLRSTGTLSCLTIHGASTNVTPKRCSRHILWREVTRLGCTHCFRPTLNDSASARHTRSGGCAVEGHERASACSPHTLTCLSARVLAHCSAHSCLV